jgi:ABC-2 type transport system permease protein
MEALRTKKLLAIASGAFFFGLLDPVMLRLTPLLLKEFSGVDLSEAIQLSQPAALMDFHQDIYQIFTIILLIVVGDVWIKEMKNRTVIIPLSKGAGLEQMLLGKVMVYSGITMAAMLISYSVNYFYSGIIFGFRTDLYQALFSGFLMGVFYAFSIVLLLVLSIVTGQFPVAMILSLGVVFAGPPVAAVFGVTVFTPFRLSHEAALFPRMPESELIVSGVITLLIMVVLFQLGSIVARRKDIVKYR